MKGVKIDLLIIATRKKVQEAASDLVDQREPNLSFVHGKQVWRVQTKGLTLIMCFLDQQHSIHHETTPPVPDNNNQIQ